MPPDRSDVVVRVLSVELEVSADEVRAARSLRNDLGMDSIAAANVLFHLEEEFGVELDLEAADRLDSLPEILQVVDRFLPSVEA